MIAQGILVLFGYLALVRALRYRRRDALASMYLYNDRESLAKMTLDDAYAIQRPLVVLEFPLTFSVSVFFALFKTYGIPSISKLLVSTGELSKPEASSKRAADTGVLITEIVLNQPGSDRSLDAMARINWLHDRYRKAGRIKDDDMLYTLSLFALEPMRWTHLMEWRKLTDVERCSLAVLWQHFGEVMDIPYGALPSAKIGWSDSLHWLEELDEWSQVYETKHMVPAESNKTLGMATVDIGLTNVPRALKPLALYFASALLPAKLRRAMKFSDPPAWVEPTLWGFLSLRRLLIRHFFLPRPSWLESGWFTSTPDQSTGNYHALQYFGHPWYIKPSFLQRWNINSWLLWLTGGFVASKSRPEYRPDGYKIPELGPVALEGKGIEEMVAAKPKIADVFQNGIGGCPIFSAR